MRAMRRAVSVLVVTVAAATAPATFTEMPKSAVPSRPDDRTIVHVLNRLGFGAAPGDLDRVRRVGLKAYIERQLHPDRIPDLAMTERLAPLATLSKTTSELAEEYFRPAQMARRDQQRQAAEGAATPPLSPPSRGSRREAMTPAQMDAVRMERLAIAELMQAKVLRAAYSERQLEEVLVDFWFNHFNVFSGKGPVRMYLSAYERDAIRPHVLGNFLDLLKATAESPAMLFYLDNWQSAAPAGPAARNRRRGLNENYARELLELHTLGVEGGYSQKDVQEVARAFTGWTIANPRQGGAFCFEPRMHDAGEKIVLGHRIEAGGGKKDGDDVLALLAKHPSTARFIASKLARRFVADQPPQALVDQAAQRFRETGGNLREVVRTIVTSPELFAAEAYRAKVKTPFEFVVSAVRAAGIDTSHAQPLVMAIRALGMPLYGCQPPIGYSDKADAWVNSGALLNRMNFAVSLTGAGGVQAEGVGPARHPGTNRTAATVSSEALVASALAGELSRSTAATVTKASTEPQALALLLGSPDFQRK
jgi:uncharacterized protein (DUF1800 family)